MKGEVEVEYGGKQVVEEESFNLGLTGNTARRESCHRLLFWAHHGGHRIPQLRTAHVDGRFVVELYAVALSKHVAHG